jgi:hypothetical protein
VGLEIINSLDFYTGDYKQCSMNAYFYPDEWWNWPSDTSHTHHQLSTLLGDITLCQASNTQQYARSLTQKCIAKKILDGFFVVLTGDLNDSHGIYSFKVFMTANQLMNPLHATFGHDPLFHTRDANSSKMKNTAIDHALHSLLPDK